MTNEVKNLDCGQLSATRHFYYNGSWQLLEERMETGGEISAYAFKQNVWGLRYIDDLMFRDGDGDDDPQTGNLGLNGSGLDLRQYFLQDANWNVVAWYSTSGSALYRFSYSAYGSFTPLSSVFVPVESLSGHDFAFTGRQYDEETGLYQYRMRSYGAELGRFLNRDPIGSAGGLNLYEYVGDSPLMRSDPSGEAGELPDPEDITPPAYDKAKCEELCKGNRGGIRNNDSGVSQPNDQGSVICFPDGTKCPCIWDLRPNPDGPPVKGFDPWTCTALVEALTKHETYHMKHTEACSIENIRKIPEKKTTKCYAPAPIHKDQGDRNLNECAALAQTIKDLKDILKTGSENCQQLTKQTLDSRIKILKRKIAEEKKCKKYSQGL